MNALTNTSGSLTESIFDNLSENILVTNDQFQIIECHGSLFKNGILKSDNIDAIFKGGAVFLKGKVKFKGKQQIKFLHDFVSTDKTIIHTKVRVVIIDNNAETKYLFYIKNNTNSKMYRKIL